MAVSSWTSVSKFSMVLKGDFEKSQRYMLKIKAKRFWEVTKIYVQDQSKKILRRHKDICQDQSKKILRSHKDICQDQSKKILRSHKDICSRSKQKDFEKSRRYMLKIKTKRFWEVTKIYAQDQSKKILRSHKDICSRSKQKDFEKSHRYMLKVKAKRFWEVTKIYAQDQSKKIVRSHKDICSRSKQFFFEKAQRYMLKVKAKRFWEGTKIYAQDQSKKILRRHKDICSRSKQKDFEKAQRYMPRSNQRDIDKSHRHVPRHRTKKIYYYYTQTRIFHLKNRKANRQLNISWCEKKLEHTPSTIYLGVTLDRTLSYNTHITKVKAKTAARNNVMRKLANSKWGTHPFTIKTTALALCYSTAEYACPVWERSAHAHKVDPVLNDACHAITGCLQPTNVENLYLLAGIAPPAVRRSVTAQREREKQVNDRHPLHGHNLPRKRLKSRNSFIQATDELIQSPSTRRLEQWSQHLQSVPYRLTQTPSECQAHGLNGDAWTDSARKWDAANTT